MRAVTWRRPRPPLSIPEISAGAFRHRVRCLCDQRVEQRTASTGIDRNISEDIADCRGAKCVPIFLPSRRAEKAPGQDCGPGACTRHCSREGKIWRVRAHCREWLRSCLCGNAHIATIDRTVARYSSGTVSPTANRKVTESLSNEQGTPCAAARTATSPHSSAW